MINDIDILQKALKSANDMCRSFHAVVERNGFNTNWETLNDQLGKSLILQHHVMYPENYEKYATDESDQTIVDIIKNDKLSASEALYGFAGWLSSQSNGLDTTDCALMADLVNRFVKENKLADPREGWHHNLIHPSGECSHGNDEYRHIEDLRAVPCKKAEIDLHQTTDATIWAAEFCKTLEKLYRIKVDEGWIIGWMANAIMCGWDHQSWKRDKEYIYILKTCGGDILKVFHWEPSEEDIREEYIKHYNEDDTGGRDYNIWDYVSLYRWSRSYGLTEMNGPKSESQYEWKATNQ